MRVIAGEARHLVLKTLPGDETRPTTDIIKETLFNMINFDIPGTKFLDLYSGSGAIGIEALSRGADESVFVDNNSKATKIIAENLEHTKLSDKATVITSEAVSALRRLENTGKVFDIIYLDPPYDQGLEDQALGYLSKSKLCSPDTMIILETGRKNEVERFKSIGFSAVKIKEYKTNKHVFLRRNA